MIHEIDRVEESRPREENGLEYRPLGRQNGVEIGESSTFRFHGNIFRRRPNAFENPVQKGLVGVASRRINPSNAVECVGDGRIPVDRSCEGGLPHTAAAHDGDHPQLPPLCRRRRREQLNDSAPGHVHALERKKLIQLLLLLFVSAATDMAGFTADPRFPFLP